MYKRLTLLFAVSAATSTVIVPFASASTGSAYEPTGPSGMSSCSAVGRSSACNWPGPTNTGYKDVVSGLTDRSQLTVLNSRNVPETSTCNGNNLTQGTLNIVCPGTVVDAMAILETSVWVSAPNVVFSRDLIADHNYGGHDGTIVTVDWSKPPSQAYLTMEDTTVDGFGYQGNNAHDIGYDNFTLLRDDVFLGTNTDVTLNGNTLVEDSWLHGIEACEAYLAGIQGNPAVIGPDSFCGIHADVIQKTEGSNDRVIHNTLQSEHHTLTSGIMCCTDQGPVTNFLVEDNLFLTDGWQLYGGIPGQHSLTGAVYENNHFTDGRADEKGLVAYAYGPGRITFSGNVNDNNGTHISN